MTFLAALNTIMLFGLWAAGTGAYPSRNAPAVRRLAALATFLGSMLAGMSIFLPILLSHGNETQSDAYPTLLLAGAVLTSCGCAAIVFVGRQATVRSHFDAAAIVAFLFSGYLVFATLDHLWFYTNEQRTGYLDGSIALEAGIACQHGFLLVKLDADERSASYRCPNNIVLGNPLDKPFVPWPTYNQGSSTELPHAMRRLESSARTAR